MVRAFFHHASFASLIYNLLSVPFLQWRVRQTLAFSIHEMAAILGEEYTTADLLPVFQGFLRDLDEVRVGVLRHLYDFFKVVRQH